MAKDPVDAHIAKFSIAQRAALRQVVDDIRATLPGATGTISYRMPTFMLDGHPVVGIDGFTGHNSLFPYSSQISVTFAKQLARYERTKGSIHFGLEDPFPITLLRRILKARVAEINAMFPTRAGVVKEFYDNGYMKMRGRMRDDQMHGDWSWWRRDGSLMRTGSFRNGQQVGEWVTYDRDSRPVKRTRIS